MEREIAESFLLTSPLSISMAELTGLNPAKMEISKENELLFKMLDVKPWPPLDWNAVGTNDHPKNINDM